MQQIWRHWWSEPIGNCFKVITGERLVSRTLCGYMLQVNNLKHEMVSLALLLAAQLLVNFNNNSDDPACNVH